MLGLLSVEAGALCLQCRGGVGRQGQCLLRQGRSSAPQEEGAEAVVVSAKIESEIAVLPAAEQKDYLDAVGLAEPGLNRVIRAGYELLDLVTYFTVGPKEARAWTVTEGTRAPQAAGVIHTDFEKGFIRAETIAYDDYVGLNGEAGARDAGKFRLEGKEYTVQDGDVLHFRFANWLRQWPTFSTTRTSPRREPGSRQLSGDGGRDQRLRARIRSAALPSR